MLFCSRFPLINVLGLSAWLGLFAGACAVGRENADGSLSPPNENLTGGGAGTGTAGVVAPVVDGGAPCALGQVVCNGASAKTCDGKGGFTNTVDCSAAGEQCADTIGCVQCLPSRGSCAGGRATVCDGTGQQKIEFACDGPGLTCDPDGCHGPCSPSEIGTGSAGCDFWPTITANPTWSEFDFAVALANASDTAANVTVERGAHFMQTASVPPASSLIVKLPWVQDLKGVDWVTPNQPPPPSTSKLVAGGAYHLRSDRPIVAYQMNVLEPELSGCSGGGAQFDCYSYSSEASLLLPSNALGSDYVSTGYRSWTKQSIGDFIAITATQDDTVIDIQPSGPLLAAPAGLDLPVDAGAFTTASLHAGDVLELFAPGLSPGDSLAGSLITARDHKPIQVISGVPCAAIPATAPWCAHIEDSVLPATALGSDYVVPMPRSAAAPADPSAADAGGWPTPVSGGDTGPGPGSGSGSGGDAGGPTGVDPHASLPAHTIRIHGAVDNTMITLDPVTALDQSAGIARGAVLLDKGQVVELRATDDLHITGSAPFAVTSFLDGPVRPVAGSASTEVTGSPAQGTIAAVHQYLDRYTVPTPPGFDTLLVSIVAPTGASVTVDGVSLSGPHFRAVGASGMSVATYRLASSSRANGFHDLRADKPFGVVLYGLAPYAGFMLTPALDAKPLPARSPTAVH